MIVINVSFVIVRFAWSGFIAIINSHNFETSDILFFYMRKHDHTNREKESKYRVRDVQTFHVCSQYRTTSVVDLLIGRRIRSRNFTLYTEHGVRIN